MGRRTFRSFVCLLTAGCLGAAAVDFVHSIVLSVLLIVHIVVVVPPRNAEG